MTFQQIYFSFKSWFAKKDLQTENERQLKWATAKRNIQLNSDYLMFEDWLNSLMFDKFEIGKTKGFGDEVLRAYYDGQFDMVTEIKESINQSQEDMERLTPKSFPKKQT